MRSKWLLHGITPSQRGFKNKPHFPDQSLDWSVIILLFQYISGAKGGDNTEDIKLGHPLSSAGTVVDRDEANLGSAVVGCFRLCSAQPSQAEHSRGICRAIKLSIGLSLIHHPEDNTTITFTARIQCANQRAFRRARFYSYQESNKS